MSPCFMSIFLCLSSGDDTICIAAVLCVFVITAIIRYCCCLYNHNNGKPNVNPIKNDHLVFPFRMIFSLKRLLEGCVDLLMYCLYFFHPCTCM